VGFHDLEEFKGGGVTCLELVAYISTHLKELPKSGRTHYLAKNA
jgi:hypothetical protein